MILSSLICNHYVCQKSMISLILTGQKTQPPYSLIRLNFHG
ncbi:hypothetical protein KSS87_017518 [Heliosperma pusillum]|nr:hypothetical protein KSS87_017518 [Heliosperma pusillum]